LTTQNVRSFLVRFLSALFLPGLVLAGLILPGLAACGGNEGPVPILVPGDDETSGGRATPLPARASGDRSASTAVGPAGGVLSLSNGARLEIPAGALAEEVELTFAIAEATRSFANREDIELVGPTVMAMPSIAAAEGKVFTLDLPLPSLPADHEPEDVTLAVEIADQTQRHLSTTTQTTWEFFPATANGGRASAELPALPGYRFQFAVSRTN
jgi:hypothetical protein